MVLPMGCSGERIEGTKQVLSKEGKDQRSRAFPAMDLTCKTLSELVCTCISVSGLELVCPSFFAHPDLCFLPFLHLDLVRIEVEHQMVHWTRYHLHLRLGLLFVAAATVARNPPILTQMKIIATGNCDLGRLSLTRS